MARDWQSLNEYTLFCRGRLANPYPLYHQLRSEDPVHWSQQANSWILTRYDDVRFALQHDPRLTAERLSLLLAQLPREVQAEVEPLRRLLSTWMQYYDPPTTPACAPWSTGPSRRELWSACGPESRPSPRIFSRRSGPRDAWT